MASLNALGGKLIYCLRSSKTVVLRDEDSRLKCINVQEILKKADRGGIHFEPYGLAYDRKAESLWLVDKLGACAEWSCLLASSLSLGAFKAARNC